MLGSEVESSPDASLAPSEIRIELGDSATAAHASPIALDGDSFDVSRGAESIVIRAGTERGLIHAATNLLEKLGAQFPPGVAPSYPRIDPARLAALEPWRVTPAFKRRAFISDIMTWDYNFPDRLDLHLRHDREFIPWMARRGINAFSYIRHAHDTRLKIDEVAPLLREHGIGVEYGGHVLQLLLPRDRFAEHPEYFPAGDDGVRAARGNLCVSNPDAVALVRQGALAYVHDHPENELLHIWGADVWRGAWCRCGQCRELPPQLQYMKVVNAIASRTRRRFESAANRISRVSRYNRAASRPEAARQRMVRMGAARAMLQSRDRRPGLRDQPALPRIAETLYRDLRRPRPHLRILRRRDSVWRLGLRNTRGNRVRSPRISIGSVITSISCLTFGAYSVMAYPVNLEAFVRGSVNPDFEPAATLVDTAARSASAMRPRDGRCLPRRRARVEVVPRLCRRDAAR